MKAAFLVAALLVTSAQAWADASSEGEAIAARDRQLNELIIRHDAKSASGFYDDQFVLTTSSGKMKSKSDLVSEIAMAGLVMEVNESSDVVVRIQQDTAVLTGILHQRGTLDGKGFDAQVRVTDTWVRDHGQWKLLAGHASRL